MRGRLEGTRKRCDLGGRFIGRQTQNQPWYRGPRCREHLPGPERLQTRLRFGAFAGILHDGPFAFGLGLEFLPRRAEFHLVVEDDQSVLAEVVYHQGRGPARSREVKRGDGDPVAGLPAALSTRVKPADRFNLVAK